MKKQNVYKTNAFLGAPVEYSGKDKSEFFILPVPYEYTTSYKKGTGRGPEAVIEASNFVEMYDEELGCEPFKKGIHTLPAFVRNIPPEKFIPALKRHYAGLADKVRKIVMIGGEHSITPGPVAALKRLYPDLSVLQFDAHADLREDYEGSKHNHACAMKRTMEYCPIVQVGIRSLSVEEAPFINKNGIATLFAHEMRKPSEIAAKALKKLSKHVYITIDVDVFDPAIIPGTGTPEPGGLGWYDVLGILRPIFKSRNVVGVDIVETCPLKGTNITEFTIAKLIYRLIGYWQ